MDQDGFNDSVSLGYGAAESLCGKYTYTLLDRNQHPAPSFISLEYGAQAPAFTLVVDTEGEPN